MRSPLIVLLTASLLACRAEGALEPAEDPSEPAPTVGAAKPKSKRPPPPPPADPKAKVARLASSQPANGDRAFYPVEIFDQGQERGVGERATLRFTFDQAMDVSESYVELFGEETLFSAGAWAADGRTLEVMLLGETDAPPLIPEHDYEVRLDRLRTAKGGSVEPSLVRFRTAARDAIIDHACIHTLYGPFAAAAAAAASPDSTLASAPSVGSVHRQWTVDLPADGELFQGQVRVTFSGSGSRNYLLLLDRDIPVNLQEESGAEIRVTPIASAPACPGIRHSAPLTLQRGKTYRLLIGPSAAPSVKLIWETP